MVTTFDYRQFAGVGTSDLEWKLRKTWSPLQLHKHGGDNQRWQPKFSQGSVGILLNTCAMRRRGDEHDVKIKSNEVSIV